MTCLFSNEQLSRQEFTAARLSAAISKKIHCPLCVLQVGRFVARYCDARWRGREDHSADFARLSAAISKKSTTCCVCCRSADSLRSAATPDGADAEIAERISLGMVRSSGGKDDTPAPLRMHCVRRLMLQLIRATRPSEQWAAPIRHDHLAGSTDETSASLRMHGARTSDASAHHGSTPLRAASCHRSGSHVTGARTRLQLLSECTVLARLMLRVITAAHPLTSERIS